MDGSSPVSTSLSFEEARRFVEKQALALRPRGKELVPLSSCTSRILAEPVNSDRDYPPFPRAARDGYAVRSADLQTLPATLAIVGEIRAGGPEKSITVGSGEAAAIMTGAPVPAGADAVVMVEHTVQKDGLVEIERGISGGNNFVPVGSEAKHGERLLSPGARLDYAAISISASVGRAHLLVYSKPRIAVLATGDEIVDLSVQPRRNQIRNSNSYSLASQIEAAGGEAWILPIAPDEPTRLKELIAEGLEADLLVISGGVSMGKYDFVEQVLAELGAEFFFKSVQIQPGRPTVFGHVEKKYFFGLPGNPVSTMVTFELFARPFVEALGGMTARKLIFCHAKLKSEIKIKTGLTRFRPANLSGEFERAEVELVRWEGSGDISAMARANCYIVIPADKEHLPAGEWVPILMR